MYGLDQPSGKQGDREMDNVYLSWRHLVVHTREKKRQLTLVQTANEMVPLENVDHSQRSSTSFWNGPLRIHQYVHCAAVCGMRHEVTDTDSLRLFGFWPKNAINKLTLDSCSNVHPVSALSLAVAQSQLVSVPAPSRPAPTRSRISTWIHHHRARPTLPYANNYSIPPIFRPLLNSTFPP